MAEKMNALAELAEDLEILKVILESEHHPKGTQIADKAQRIITELAKVFELIDKSQIKRDDDSMVHLADFLEADTQRAFAVLRNCREIAEEGVSDGTAC